LRAGFFAAVLREAVARLFALAPVTRLAAPLFAGARFVVAFLAVPLFAVPAFVRRAAAVFLLGECFLLTTLRALFATVETAPPTALPTPTAMSLAASKPAPAVSSAELRMPSLSVSIGVASLDLSCLILLRLHDSRESPVEFFPHCRLQA
jgi:hypothetical protein